MTRAFLSPAVLILLAFGTLRSAEQSTQELLSKAEARIEAEDLPTAESLLSTARKQDPSNVEVLYRLGYVHYRQRNLTQARTEFGEVVKRAPPAWYSRYFLGRIALFENKPHEAVAWFEPIVSANQVIFDTPAQLASGYAAIGNRAKAIAALRIAINAMPWDASLYYRLGRLYADSGQADLAEEAYENSRRLRNANREDVAIVIRVSQALSAGNPVEGKRLGMSILDRPDADPNALVALGVIYGGANLAVDALTAFERAAEREPSLFQAQYNRGLALLKLNRAAEALLPLSRAMNLLPKSVEANRTYGLAAVMNQQYADAVAPLERAYAAEREDVRTGTLLATAYLRTGAAKKAAELLAADTFRKAGDPSPLLLRAEALNAAEDSTGALEAAQEAQQRFPAAPEAHMAVAGQLTRLGRYQEAKPEFERVLKLAPGYPEAELGLADSLSKSGDYAGAIIHYTVVINVDRTAIPARAGVARSLIALRRFDEARKLLEDSVSAYPSEAALHAELSRVYARLGKPELAAEQTRIVETLRDPVSRQ
jgi:tetratricopeptide (TPR) repeat protein